MTGPVSRLALFRGEWLVIQANIDPEDMREDPGSPPEEASVYVSNADAARVAALKETVAFFASVIKNGERWTPTCEAALRRALGAKHE